MLDQLNGLVATLSGSVPELLQIMWLNVILSADNAVVIGLAAAGLPEAKRNKAVLFGIIVAAVLRIVFSLFASRLLGYWEVEIVGGLLLLYIAWGFMSELLEKAEEEADPEHHPHEDKSMMRALWQIIIADVSMSLDNVLAVAAVARDHETLLIVGLLVSIILMGVLGGVLARVLDRFPIIAWIGLAFIVWIALKLGYEGLEHGNIAQGWGLKLPHDFGELRMMLGA